MPTLQRNGVAIRYEDHGRGPVILLSHGYSATSQMWAGQVDDLQSDYRVITWDLRGHGQSDSPEESADYSRAPQSATCGRSSTPARSSGR